MNRQQVIECLKKQNTPESSFCRHHMSVWTDAGKALWLADSEKAGKFLPVRPYQVGGEKCPK